MGNKSLLFAITDKLNEIIDRALSTDASHLFFINADVELPKDGLRRLFMMDVDVASGIYPFHGDSERMVAGVLGTGPRLSYQPFARDDIVGKILGEEQKVAAGDGCLLIKRRVVEWSSRYYAPLRFNCSDGVASDIRFFHDAQVRGFSTRINGNVICGHNPQHPLET